MRLNKISLKQLKKDLRKLNTKRRSRFGEGEEKPLEVTGQKVELKKKRSLKDRYGNHLKDFAKVAAGLAAVGVVAAGAHKGIKAAKNSEAGQTISDAVSQRVAHEKAQAEHKVNQAATKAEHVINEAKAKGERERREALDRLDKATKAQAQRIGQDLGKVAGSYNKAVGDVKAAGHELKGKALEEWNKSSVITSGANNLASWIAPPQGKFGRSQFGNKFKELVKKHKQSLITAGKVAGGAAAVAGVGLYANKKRKERLEYEASPEFQEAKRKKEEEKIKAAKEAQANLKLQAVVDRRKSRLQAKEQGKAMLANERLIAENEKTIGARLNKPLTVEQYKGQAGDLREKTKMYNEVKKKMRKQKLEYDKKIQELQVKITNLTTVYNHTIQIEQPRVYQQAYQNEQKAILDEKNKRLNGASVMQKNLINFEYSEGPLNKKFEQRRVNAANNAVTAWTIPIKEKYDHNITRLNNEINFENDKFNAELIEDKNKLKQYSQFGKLRFGRRM
jgi:hypothetical protein